MKLLIAHLPKLIAQRRSSAILGTIIIAMLWAGITVKYFESVRTDRSEAERTNENFAMVFEENVLRSLSEVDIPGWETSESAAEWVRASRKSDEERLNRQQHDR